MVLKRNTRKLQTATFGVAMSSLFVVNDMNAEILDLTWEGGEESIVINREPSHGGTFDAELINIDQVIGPVELSVFNTNFSNGVQHMEAIYGLGMLTGLEIVDEFELLDPTTFLPESIGFGGIGNFNNGTCNGTCVTSAFAGFTTSTGNVGWFKIELLFPGIPQIPGWRFTNGRVATQGESLCVGATSPVLGDVNCDGLVNLLDVAPFVDLLSSGGFSENADANEDGQVNLLDVAPFVDLLSGP